MATLKTIASNKKKLAQQKFLYAHKVSAYKDFKTNQSSTSSPISQFNILRIKMLKTAA